MVQGASSTNDAGHFSSTSGTGVSALSTTGDALYAYTGSGDGVLGASIYSANAYGGDISGSVVGVVGRSNVYPLLLSN